MPYELYATNSSNMIYVPNHQIDYQRPNGWPSPYSPGEPKPVPRDNMWRRPPCLSPSHNPPSHMVYPPGWNTYRCPACGEEFNFYVTEVICKAGL